jgi:hypothetical protein
VDAGLRDGELRQRARRPHRHKAEIVKIAGRSYREKEAAERAERRAAERKARTGKRRSS